eukprot:403351214
MAIEGKDYPKRVSRECSTSFVGEKVNVKHQGDHHHVKDPQKAVSLHLLSFFKNILQKNDQQKYQIQQIKARNLTKAYNESPMIFDDFQHLESPFEGFNPSYNHPIDHMIPNEWYCSTSDNNQDCCFNQLFDGSSNQGESINQDFQLLDMELQPQPQARDSDHDIIFRQIQKSLSKKSSSKSLDRPDVIIKTIFRICRAFFTSRLDDQKRADIKKYGKKRALPLLHSLDSLIEKVFSRYVQDPQLSNESLANYMLALIYPKSIQTLDLDDGNHYHDKDVQIDPLDDLSRPPSKKETLQIAKNMRQQQRLINILELSKQTQSVLYSFNKKNLRAFLKIKENSLILQHFLRKSLLVYEQYADIFEDQSKIKLPQKKKYRARTKPKKNNNNNNAQSQKRNFMTSLVDDRTLRIFYISTQKLLGQCQKQREFNKE